MKLREVYEIVPKHMILQIWKQNKLGTFESLAKGTLRDNKRELNVYSAKKIKRLVAVGYGRISITVE